MEDELEMPDEDVVQLPGPDMRYDDDTGKLLCRGTKKNGRPCGMPPSLVDQEVGYCDAHNPDKQGEMSERAAKGGRRTNGGIGPNFTPAEIRDRLGKLEDYEDGKRWMVFIAQKVLAGELAPELASQARMAIKEWRKHYERGEIADAERAAQSAMEKAEGAFGPRLVEGS